MRKIATFIVSLLIGTPMVIGQAAPSKVYTSKSDCDAVTQRAISQAYSYDRQLELDQNPQKLAILDYMYAYSYEFAPGQMVLRSHKQLINVDKYKHLRHATKRVSVYDDSTQMTLVLYSWEEVTNAITTIQNRVQLASTR